jgi:hypothetical protein
VGELGAPLPPLRATAGLRRSRPGEQESEMRLLKKGEVAGFWLWAVVVWLILVWVFHDFWWFRPLFRQVF